MSEIMVKEIDKETWKRMAHDAHISVFDEHINPEKEVIDYALITVDSETDDLIQYVTIREFDKDSGHWFWGGSFPKYRGSIKAHRSMDALLGFMKAKYKKMSYLTGNTNFAMLKFGIKNKFQIVGTRLADGGLLLEHVLEFKKGEN